MLLLLLLAAKKGSFFRRKGSGEEEKRINPFLYRVVVLFTVLFVEESFSLLRCYTYRLECQAGETGMSALQIYLAVRGTYTFP